VDGDPHVYIFLGNVPGVGGYFSSPDEYPVEVRPHSNEHEMFYINLENAGPGSDYFDGILAHEFQHMIHWAVDRNEDTWVNEGLSELAALVNGYDVGGSDYLFGLQPDSQLTAWPELEESGPHYGASYLFLAYFLDQYGEAAVRHLVDEAANGRAGFEAILAEVDPGRTFDQLFADWLLANYLDSVRGGGQDYQYSNLRLEPPRTAAQYTSYPISQKATVHQYAADYVLLEGEGDVTLTFTGSQVVSLVGNEPYSGDRQWWAMRGDEGDARLTRAFDLSGLEEASLQVQMWYDLETDYDYAYVQVSIDGGETWQILANEHTTITDPSGNSYGPAFTGLSGGSKEANWVEEVFDLSPYSGGELLVRFEVITDDAVNHPGLCLDDIRVPELGYEDGAEDDGGGWSAEGWVRVTGSLPQAYLVQVITIGRQVEVQRLQLDEQKQGRLTIAGLGRDVDRAVLVVAGLTPVTTEWASYAYRIEQD
jgi:hypothetical protein